MNYKMNEYVLGDCCRFIDYRGKTPTKTNEGIPLVTAKIIKEGVIQKPTEFIAVEAYSEWMRRGIPQEGDVIITTEAPLGEVAQIKTKDKLAFAQRLIILHPKRNILNQNFLYYLLRWDETQKKIAAKATGTTVVGIKAAELRTVQLQVPPMRNQQLIAATLSCLDDKIEVNNRIIANLEARAQAIFKNWFVDFEPFQDGEFDDSELGLIPKGWTVVPFTEIVRVLGGGTPKTDIVDNWNGDIPFFTPKDVGSKTYTLKTEKTLSQKGLSSCNSGLYPENTVFVTARGTVGKIALAGKAMAMNQSCYALVGKNGISQFFVYHLTQNTVERLKGKASGAVFDAIVTRDFDSEMVVSPKENTIVTFSSLVDPLYKQMLCLEKQSIALRTTRDTLLPKLMSGEIEVPVEG